MASILDDLNSEQRIAAETVEGPLLILAGAGSGKTKTLTYRIANLISQHGVQPEEILAVTFTNKAAGEMRERVAKLLGRQAHDRSFMPWMGTFHGICVRLLRQSGEHIGIPRDFVIFDEQDRTGAVREAMKRLRVDTKETTPKTISYIISSAKNELMTHSTYQGLAKTPVQRTAAQVWPEYEKVLKEAKALDFDDLIGKTVRLLAKNEEVRERWRRQFKFVMIDEYQDTNTAQYKLIKLLTSTNRNICVVGDDWQSIYSWRGADFRNILNFEKDYPGAKVVKLERNYRSTKPILEAAQTIINKNQQRTDKKLWTERSEGAPVELEQVIDEVAEAEAVVRRIKEAVPGKRKWSDFAVLYRTNAQSRSLEEAFVRYSVPYRIIGGVRFYERAEIKDLVAYLRFIYQPSDATSFARIVNTPGRGLGSKSIANFTEWARINNLSVSAALERVESINNLTPRAKKALHSFGEMTERLRDYAKEASVAELIEAVIARTGFEQHLKDSTIGGEERFENVKELVSVAKGFEQLDLATFLEEVALVSDLDGYDNNSNSVTLMTLHAAKGLEFSVVFMVGLEESLFPHSRALFDQQELEEERRLCYVGMTRAREELYLMHASRRLVFGSVQHNPPSRFIAELGDLVVGSQVPSYTPSFSTGFSQPTRPSVDFAVGERVGHKIFGTGTIVALEGEVATIKFASRGEKKLNTAFAPLEKLGSS